MFWPNGLRAIPGALLLLAALATLAVRPAAAAVIAVPADQPTIAAGLAAAAAGDTVDVACGTWHEHDLVITRAVTLRGQASSPTCVRIDADGLGRVLDVAAAPGDTVTLADLTFTGGAVAGGFLESLGGGVRAMDTALRAVRCIFESNTAVIGGGLGVSASWLEATDCTFAANAAADPTWAGGGGAWCRDSRGSITDAIFTLNTAFSQNPADPGDGGGLFMNNSDLAVVRGFFNLNATGGGAGALYSVDTDSARVIACRFEMNTAQWGGALFIENAAATLDSCTVQNNTATVSGGALAVGRGAKPVIRTTRFQDNVAQAQNGGAVQSDGSRPSFTACTFLDNSAPKWGGAVNINGLGSTYTDCVFAGNTAGQQGGAVRQYSSTAAFTGCTLVGNGAPVGGALSSQSLTSATLARTIIAFGTQGEAVTAALFVPVTATCTDIHGNPGGDWTGTLAAQLGTSGNIALDPQFTDAAAGDYTLLWTSPCAPASSGACGLIGALGVVNDLSDVPDAAPAAALTLRPNYPNPFNPSTTLRFALAVPGRVQVRVFDAAG
ncbi:MAG TPA: hypothetical protein PLQ13_12985, partial [Candidatus Krumholzibacteria bacterium]|nr:hypothetical protein [Candidatus Krumholzibacteria bacterium]